MADFQATCGSSSAEDEGQRLRDAVRLFSGKAASDGAEVRRLVEAEAFESAAIFLVGEALPFLLSRGGDGTCLASIVAPDGEEILAEGATPALALLGAYAGAALSAAAFLDTGATVVRGVVPMSLN